MEVKDIQARFNLSRNYITSCLNQLESFFEGHVDRGENNRLLFDSSAFKLFESISNFKSLGKTLPQIRRKLEEEQGNQRKPEGNEEDSVPSTPKVEEGNSITDKLLNALTEAHKVVLKSKDETIAGLRQQLLSLTDGRSVEEIRTERERIKKYNEQRSQLINAMLENENKFWPSSKTRRTCMTELRKIEMQRQNPT